jgi:hypothetical protein
LGSALRKHFFSGMAVPILSVISHPKGNDMSHKFKSPNATTYAVVAALTLAFSALAFADNIRAIGPKPDDPLQGDNGMRAIGPKPDDPLQSRAIGPKPDDPLHAGKNINAIGPKPDDPLHRKEVTRNTGH